MSDYLKAREILSGQDGDVIIEWNGRIYDAKFIKKVFASVAKSKEPVKVLRKRGTQYRTNGWEGSGTLTYFMVSSVFREMADFYNTTGEDPDFTMTVINKDPSGRLGSQKTILYNCNLDEMVLANLDVDAPFLEEEIAFTFDDFDTPEKFNKL